MSVIHTIAAQRQKLLDGLDANEGDINLRIFEDFYPDEAHFIYELLQNAEDAGATDASFELFDDACVFQHNGSRHFNERDIRGITGIFNSSKKDNSDKIGKFGVGFKSVFVYTDSPVVYSRDYSFQIVKLVLPKELPAKPGLGDKTRFEFPFNNPKKSASEAFAEVKAGLEQLSETTLLFLNNLRYISWTIGLKKGEIMREEHSAAHVEVLKSVEGEDVHSSHWLRFAEQIDTSQPITGAVDGIEKQKVAVAYELALLSDVKHFDPQLAFSKQFKIVPAVRGKVSVFFPAEKETSGLRFHLHGPFIPELSRASIKNCPENVPLFDQLAALSASSLHAIKKLGLLTGEFLAVLPNNDDQLPERYVNIRKAILAEMRTTPLVPTNTGRYAPAQRLYQARAALKALISGPDLAFVTGRIDEPGWAIGATQRNSNQDRFLASLNIASWDADDLKAFLEARASDEAWDNDEPDPEVVAWLKGKPAEWFQALYAALLRHCEDHGDYGNLDEVLFVKLVSGELGIAKEAYFQASAHDGTDPLPKVDNTVFTVGTKKSQQEDAKRFLEKLGVRVPNETDQIHLLLQARYREESEVPDDDVYLADLKRMISFLEKNPDAYGTFSRYYLFKVDAPEFDWGMAEHVYIDEPFASTGLKCLHELQKDQDKRRWPLNLWYASCGIPLDKIVKFAEKVGCQVSLKEIYVRTSCFKNPQWPYLRTAPGGRQGNSINRDFLLTAEAWSLLGAKRLDTALLFWNVLRKADFLQPSIWRACYQVTEKGGPLYAPSQLICQLQSYAWVPQTDGSFVKPSEASLANLPRGFYVDPNAKWLEAIGFGAAEKKRITENTQRAAQRDELGFKSEEELRRAQEFVKLSEEQQRRILEEIAQRQHEPVELPERAVRNLALRQQRVGDEARKTPEKEAEIRPRAVQVGVAETKIQAKLYLADQYTNGNGEMICQACKDELPFKLLNGAYYFEAVEVVADSRKRFREAFLALCPNHAAAYQYANAQKHSMLELLETANGSEIEVCLGGIETTIYFTQAHLADICACFEADVEEA
ncbi:hypothetical protein LQ564_00090 [Massilia sp. G4R7]|uniref:Sacsin/Nov domain-containing protein n=1 Tax=Massilia phyllostachyos TaxID=2898585 RepID=A0ABS8PYY4_9BURK|nr:hypothetical protein [Massilia phyllostachyos]MCD2514708.1 hypothetical protein [Massilia phyllostachyos]